MCDILKVRNPDTGRCVLRSGKLGKSITKMKKVKKSPKKYSRPRRMSIAAQYPLAFDVFIEEVIGSDVANDMKQTVLERRFAKFVDSIEYEDLSSSIKDHAIWPPFATREMKWSDPAVEKALKKALKKDGFEFVQKEKKSEKKIEKKTEKKTKKKKYNLSIFDDGYGEGGEVEEIDLDFNKFEDILYIPEVLKLSTKKELKQIEKDFDNEETEEWSTNEGSINMIISLNT